MSHPMRFTTDIEMNCKINGKHYSVQADRHITLDGHPLSHPNSWEFVEDEVSNVWVTHNGEVSSIGDIHPNDMGKIMHELDMYKENNAPNIQELIENDLAEHLWEE